MSQTLAVKRCEKMTATVKLCAEALRPNDHGEDIIGVPGIVMELIRNGNPVESITTTASGLVAFASVGITPANMGNYSVRAIVGPGVVGTYAFRVDPSQNAERGNLFNKTGKAYVHKISFYFTTGWVAVRVRNATGALLTGVTVSLTSPIGPAILKTLAKADLLADGSYRLEPTPAGNYQISFPDFDQDSWAVNTAPPPVRPLNYFARPKHEDPPGPGHTVVVGDCAWSLAVTYAVTEDAIWAHVPNQALTATYPNRYTLLPGQTVQIPRRPKSVTCASSACHDFLIPDPPTRELIVRLVDWGQPAPIGLVGTVAITNHPDLAVTTEAGGVLKIPIPFGATAAKLTLPEFGLKEYTLQLGHLAPIESPEGVRQRLSNLGLFVDPPDVLDRPAALLQAVNGFQKLKTIPLVDPDPLGKVNSATSDALVAACGS